MNEIIEIARTKEVRIADGMPKELLYQYPSSISLKYQAAVEKLRVSI